MGKHKKCGCSVFVSETRVEEPTATTVWSISRESNGKRKKGQPRFDDDPMVAKSETIRHQQDDECNFATCLEQKGHFWETLPYVTTILHIGSNLDLVEIQYRLGYEISGRTKE